MGSEVLMLVRFIEATEVDDVVPLIGPLDITAPLELDEEAGGRLWDNLMQLEVSMPSTSAFKTIKDWSPIYDSIIQCATVVLNTIVDHPMDTCGSRLKVGGALGLFPALRALEFLRRFIVIRDTGSMYKDRINAVFAQYDDILAKEQFRRWASSSFALGTRTKSGKLFQGAGEMEATMRSEVSAEDWFGTRWKQPDPELVRQVALEAQLRSRRVKPQHLLANFLPELWSGANVIDEIRRWVLSMNEDIFAQGSVVERFLWTFTVHMVAGPGKQGGTDWCKGAVNATTEWLGHLIGQLEPGLMSERDVLVGVRKPVRPPSKLGRGAPPPSKTEKRPAANKPNVLETIFEDRNSKDTINAMKKKS
ncbi:hypothetical protein M422DRAFT_43115 [Sphaerobolus stellatus SS14]|nr:hypothetical protein M422DRAFT_43115 [Sphaerobolus stellatus SS14]